MMPIESNWVDTPTCAGVYWMYDKNEDFYKICEVVEVEEELYIKICGYAALFSLKEEVKEMKFFGPLCLPQGGGVIYRNAMYKEGGIVEPKE